MLVAFVRLTDPVGYSAPFDRYLALPPANLHNPALAGEFDD